MQSSSHPDEQFDVPLQKLNSWHVGGAAERFFKPQSVQQLQQYCSALPQEISITWLGLGSNLLVRDGGVAGSVIYTRDLSELKWLEPGVVYAQAGVSCAKFARFCAQQGYVDAAFFAGIPGTIGGALAMNAGAFGGQTWEHVVQTDMVTREGTLISRQSSEFDIAYRHVAGKAFNLMNEGFVGAIFRFGDLQQKGSESIKQLLRQRGESQPIGTFNCGSVYRNPEGDYAARLIEASGLKGYQQNNVGVSDKHANFIINYGNGKASDIESLMALIESTVLQDSGIVLKPEVRIVGKV